MAGYLCAPGPFVASQFFLTAFGTALTIASAHALNQYVERDYDAMMNRTSNRVLPRGEMDPNRALAFGIGTGVLGSVLLATTVNPLAAALAGGNILLYVLAYTPLKRIHWINTWVGAVVGGIPPLIGWAAMTGGMYNSKLKFNHEYHTAS